MGKNSNGTFYNYFGDREELIDQLAVHLVTTLAEDAARQLSEADPARRFAFATGRVLARVVEDPTWGRVVLRLLHGRTEIREGVARHLRDDLDAGLAQGRFAFGADDATLDLVTGTLVMAIRRIVEGRAAPDYPQRVVERALAALGVAPAEAAEIATSG